MSISIGTGAGGSSFHGHFASSAVDRGKLRSTCREYQIPRTGSNSGKRRRRAVDAGRRRIPLSRLAVVLVLFVFAIVSLLRRFFLFVILYRGSARLSTANGSVSRKRSPSLPIHTHATLPSLTSTTLSGWPPDFRMTTSPGYRTMICSSVMHDAICTLAIRS